MEIIEGLVIGIAGLIIWMGIWFSQGVKKLDYARDQVEAPFHHKSTKAVRGYSKQP